MPQKHITSISSSRLRPYKELAKKIVNEAKPTTEQEEDIFSICLYTAIQHRLSIFFSLIQDIEISVRNRISLVIEEYAKAKQQNLETYLIELAIDDNSPLTKNNRQKLKTAILNITGLKTLTNTTNTIQMLNEKGKNVNDIIPNLTFGFWVNLMNHKDKSYSKEFKHWNKIFYSYKLFDNRFVSIKEIYDRLSLIVNFRNKLYHQEPVWKRKNIRDPKKALLALKNKYDDFSKILALISPERQEMRQKIMTLKNQYDTTFNSDIFIEEIIFLYENFNRAD